jgi:hypothetical protein
MPADPPVGRVDGAAHRQESLQQSVQFPSPRAAGFAPLYCFSPTHAFVAEAGRYAFIRNAAFLVNRNFAGGRRGKPKV